MGKRGKKKACACSHCAETSADAAMSRYVYKLGATYTFFLRIIAKTSNFLPYQSIFLFPTVK